MKEKSHEFGRDFTNDLTSAMRYQNEIIDKGRVLNEGILASKARDRLSLAYEVVIEKPADWEAVYRIDDSIVSIATGISLEILREHPLQPVPPPPGYEDFCEVRDIPLTPQASLRQEHVIRPNGTGTVRFIVMRYSEGAAS